MRRRLVLPTLLLVALTACSGGDDEPTDDGAAQPVPPEGMVYVGVDGVVAAVPETWTQGVDPRCGVPEARTYFLAEADRSGACPEEPESSAYEADFVAVSATSGPGFGGYPCLSICPAVWELDGVQFFVTVGHPLLGREPAPTLRLPDGFTTVPFWPAAATEDDYRAVLAGAGLDDVVTIDDAGARTTTPAQGTVVRTP